MDETQIPQPSGKRRGQATRALTKWQRNANKSLRKFWLKYKDTLRRNALDSVNTPI